MVLMDAYGGLVQRKIRSKGTSLTVCPTADMPTLVVYVMKLKLFKTIAHRMCVTVTHPPFGA